MLRLSLSMDLKSSLILIVFNKDLFSLIKILKLRKRSERDQIHSLGLIQLLLKMIITILDKIQVLTGSFTTGIKTGRLNISTKKFLWIKLKELMVANEKE